MVGLNIKKIDLRKNLAIVKNIEVANWFKKEALGYARNKLFVLFITLPLPFAIALLAYVLGATSTVIVSLFSLGIIFVVLPYLIFSFLEVQEITLAEDNYPNFLRDLSQNVSAGMTLPQAVDTCAKSRYGNLSKYLERLNIWLSWSTPFPEAWEKFTKLLERSSLIKRINGIILEAFYSGGDIKVTLNSLADDVTLLKEMESEKKSVMRQQMIILYIIYFIFLGVIIGIYKILAPILYIQKIGMFAGISLQTSSGPQMSIEFFKNLFFMMTLVEAACAGVLIGQIAEENWLAGVKHIVVMLSVGICVFFALIFPAHLSLDLSVFPPSVETEGKINIVGQVYYESSPVIGSAVEITTPSGETHTLITDNFGEYKDMFIAPQQTGVYSITAIAKYKGATITRSEKITVK